jgi:cyclic pyranopterin phosphate synthase
MPKEGVAWKSHDDILRFEESLRLCRLLCELGIRRIKLTGGEPLIRRGVDNFIRQLRKIPELEQVTLTTNGHVLGDFLDRLGQEAVTLIDGINISLNTTDPATYAAMARFDGLNLAMNGMRRAIEAGISVKLNCVPVRGLNEGDLVNLALEAKSAVKAVRFIELMPMGVAAGLKGIPMAEIIALFEKNFGPLIRDDAPMGNGPAVYYRVSGFKGKIGFISSMSEIFCAGCNRLRLSSDGYLKACLASDKGSDLKALLRSGASDEALKEVMLRLVASKPKAHSFVGSSKPEDDKGPSEERTYQGPEGMYRIGG